MSGLWPIGIGYISAPAQVGIGCWTRWHDGIESHAGEAGIRLLRIVTDDHTSSGAGLGDVIATLRAGHISVVVVPSLEHLSLTRDGTHEVVRALLNLHFGVRVEQAGGDRWSPPATTAGRSAAKARDGALAPEDFDAVLSGALSRSSGRPAPARRP